MISPLVEEEVWIHALQSTPHWLPPAKHTVIIAPHPDDETLGAGGLIAQQSRRGLHVECICVTDGEAAYPDTPDLAATRTIEQQLALESLGVPFSGIMRLGLPDSKVAAHESELVQKLTPFIRRDTLVVAPWVHDWHPDHEACGRAAERVSRACGAQMISYLFWTWHQATADDLVNETVCRFELDHYLWSLKQNALTQHRSQLWRKEGDPILPEQLLQPARRAYETFIQHD